MKKRSAKPSEAPAWRRRLDWSAPALAATLYVGTVLVVYPFRHTFEFDSDEGINAIKALLVDHGHALYSQIWDDQPPLLTYLLRWWCRVVGWDTYNGRLLVLLIAGLLVFAVYDTLRNTYGHAAAIAAVLLLPCTAYFTRLSVSIMIGLPAIACATLCVAALVRWATTHRTGWLVAAGVLMGLSLATKLFTLFLVPVFGLWVTWRAVREPGRVAEPRRAPWWRILVAPGLWGCVVLLTAAGVFMGCVRGDGWHQLYQPHMAASAAQFGNHDVTLLHRDLRMDWEVMVLAGLGTVLMAVRRSAMLVLVPAWGVAAYWALRTHAPIWYHHHLLLSVPACMAAGIAVGDLFTARPPSTSVLASAAGIAVRVVTLGTLIALVVALASGAKHEPSPHAELSDHDRLVVELITAYPKRSSLMVADRPMFAFATGYEVPLNLAVTSRKRAATDNLTLPQFLDTIDRENPEHVIFSSRLREFVSPFANAMQGRYQMVYADLENSDLQVFVRSDIAGDRLPMLLRAAERVPNVAAAHDAIGIEWAKRGDTERAVASFDRANALDPQAVRPRLHLADAHLARGEYAAGFALLQAGMQRERSGYAAVALQYAWRRATCPDAVYRNGAEAELIARAMPNLGEQAALFNQETLAASLAAQGRFDAARATAEQTLHKAQVIGQGEVERRVMGELEAYRGREMITVAVQMPTS